MLWDGDLSCPPARDVLSRWHWGLSPPRCAPAWQPGCRAPSSPGTHGNTVPGERAGAGRRADFRPLPSAAPGPSPHPPCSPPSLDDSWLPVYTVQQETVDFIHAFVTSPQQVTVPISPAALPASADRGSAAGLLELCWLGRAASPSSPTRHCAPGAPVPLAACPLSHAPRFSLCPPAARRRASRWCS